MKTLSVIFYLLNVSTGSSFKIQEMINYGVGQNVIGIYEFQIFFTKQKQKTYKIY